MHRVARFQQKLNSKLQFKKQVQKMEIVPKIGTKFSCFFLVGNKLPVENTHFCSSFQNNPLWCKKKKTSEFFALATLLFRLTMSVSEARGVLFSIFLLVNCESERERKKETVCAISTKCYASLKQGNSVLFKPM